MNDMNIQKQAYGTKDYLPEMLLFAGRSDHSQHGTSRNSGTDNTCYVGAHSVHQQEVGRISLLTYNLGYTGSHRNGGYARGTDQRIDFAAGSDLHQLAKETTRSRAGCESNQT